MKGIPLFKGSYKAYYEHVRKQTLFDNGKIRVKRNFHNLGLWLVKDSQGRNTLNLFKLRIQFI